MAKQLKSDYHDSLKEIGRQVRKSNKRSIKDPLPGLHSIGNDGVDHINIWEKGATELGVFLAHGTNVPVRHNHFGVFNSVECFWHYIRSEERDDRLRSMSSLKAKKFGNMLTPRRVPNFYAVIMDTNWQKLKQHPEYMELLKNSELPLDMYYLLRDDIVRIRPKFAHWALRGFEEIRSALKENREPNFDFLKDRTGKDTQGSDIYEPLLQELRSFHRPAKAELPRSANGNASSPTPVEIPEELSEEELAALDEKINGNLVPDEVVPVDIDDELRDALAAQALAESAA